MQCPDTVDKLAEFAILGDGLAARYISLERLIEQNKGRYYQTLEQSPVVSTRPVAPERIFTNGELLIVQRGFHRGRDLGVLLQAFLASTT